MIRSPKFWYKNNLISQIFVPISFIWIFIDFLKRKFSNPYKSRLKIICVGNVNVGGSGKTPLCIHLFRHLKELNFNPIFLSSGYGGENLGPVIVNKYKEINFFGDEAILLSKHGPTIVSKNRYKGIKLIEKEFGEHDIVIMDDGLQNYELYKDLNLLAIDRKMLFGNQRCLPAGPLRQTIKTCMKQIDAIIFTGNKSKENLSFSFLKIKFETYISANYKKLSMKNNYMAFCGLADNEKFFDTLKNIGLKVLKNINFYDHARYSDTIVEKLIKEAKQQKLRLITTEKDMVKIKKKYHKFIDILPIEINMNAKESKKFKLYLNKKLNA